MVITEEFEISDKMLASGRFADVEAGTYMGLPAAVKQLLVAEQDALSRIRKVRIRVFLSATWDAVLSILH